MELKTDVVRANLSDSKNYHRNQRGALVREFQDMRLSVFWTKSGYRWLLERPGHQDSGLSLRHFNTEGQALRSLAEAVVARVSQGALSETTEGMT
jgi:hypothetical protein